MSPEASDASLPQTDAAWASLDSYGGGGLTGGSGKDDCDAALEGGEDNGASGSMLSNSDE